MCGWGGNGWMWNGGGWGWGWIVGAVVLVVLFALVITAVILTVRYFSEGGGHRGPGSPQQARGAEDVLGERFARGEIDEDEYRRRMTTLQEHRS
ncbi:SHOCT domain-containing protein [Mycobacterium sp.]|uniref:SHOCT domain-containing protein n=1 Tax=Mycobacterium sp. TaxID=1785 RepID=UPI003F9822D9